MLELSQEQRAAVEHGLDNHVLVMAGAGSGKTRTIAARVLHLIHSNIPPQKIVLLTFTRRAASEMRTRLEAELGNQATTIRVGTFHFFALGTMKRHEQLFGIAEYTIADRDDANELMKFARGETVGKHGDKSIPNVNELAELFGYARNTLRPMREYLQEKASLDETALEKVLAIFKSYQARKQRARLLDYDDLLILFAKTLEEVPEFAKKLPYEYVLVDELQDTNPVQYSILQSLRKGGAKLFCVGDARQSVYSFRGAHFEHIYHFTDVVADTTTYSLRENYRSYQEILDLANHTLSQSELDYGDSLIAIRGKNGVLPTMNLFQDSMEEARFIGDQVTATYQESGRWQDSAVIVRTALGARHIEGIFLERNIPYIFIGGQQLLTAAHVKDIICLLRLAVNPFDEIAAMRTLTFLPKVGEVRATKIIEAIHSIREPLAHLDLYPLLAAGLPIIQGEKGGGLARCLENVWLSQDQPQKALRVAIEFLAPFQKNKYDNYDRRRKDLELLADLAKKHVAVYEFLEVFTLDPVHISLISGPEEADAVVITTAHSAKGAEYANVIISEVKPGSFPHARSAGNQVATEEERRLLYVAMTRAKDSLTLTQTMQGATYRAFWMRPSPEENFLEGCPTSVLARHYHNSPPSFSAANLKEDFSMPGQKKRLDRIFEKF